MKNIFLVAILLFIGNTALACGSACCQKEEQEKSKVEKSCCSEQTEKKVSDKKSCCSQNDESENKSCNGGCKHRGCHCSTVINYFVTLKESIDINIAEFSKSKENLWGLTNKSPKPVYLAIWQPPKI